jgi:hypothetical protein
MDLAIQSKVDGQMAEANTSLMSIVVLSLKVLVVEEVEEVMEEEEIIIVRI